MDGGGQGGSTRKGGAATAVAQTAQSKAVHSAGAQKANMTKGSISLLCFPSWEDWALE